MPARRPQLQIVAPSASPEEAAVVVAGLERFMRETAPGVGGPGVGGPESTASRRSPWLRAALYEATGREPDEPSPWGDPHPWG